MSILIKFLLQQIILLGLVYCTHCKPNWNYELINIAVENFSPDIVVIDLFRTTVRRGVHGIGGTIDIKQDIDTDHVQAESVMYISRTGSKGSYVKSPIYSINMTLAEFGKKIYQPYFLDSLMNCSENPWQLGPDGQLEPLTKRVMKYNNCIFTNVNMPSHMTEGYYRIVGYYRNQAEGKLIYDFVITTD